LRYRKEYESLHFQEAFMNSDARPDYTRLVFIPALITLAVTLLRLVSEFMNLPPWLASKEAGGAAALIGISWLPPIFGVYFAAKLAHAPGKLWKNLLKTLLYYGLAARIPVIVIMGFAIFGDWGTHYDAFPPDMADMTPAMKFLFGAVLTQLIFWAGIWTVGTGMLTGLIAAKLRSPKHATA
ncbi:MAG: hypothetical protein ACRD3V_15380, partial [Vicinamibacteria bacterium]